MNQTDSKIAYELAKPYPVSPATLFNALTDATVLKTIWGVQQITVDARVGGKTAAVYLEGSQDWSFTLTYTEVVPNEKLSWVTHFKSFPAKETRVTVLLNAADQGTELLIRMGNFETVEERDANQQAWLRGLARLADILA